MAHDILIVDDEADIRSLVAGILEDEGHHARHAFDGPSAFAATEARRPNLVLLDIWLEGSEVDGMEILEQLRVAHPEVPVVMMSGHGTIETAVKAINLGAYDFIEKPFTADRLVMVVERAVESASLKREIGNSAAINQLRQSIQRVAPSNSRVLISGPAGSGKELVARLLHSKSHRATGPFVVLNCATMQPNGFEASLFGIEHAGEGNGAHREIGTLEQAHNGTLFLDEVADMPLETQGKIVRVLQEQKFQRVGGATQVEVDVRVIASSSRDLSEEMAQGRFREDLFYRLSVVPVEVPPLRDYREDIPILIDHFIQRATETSGLPARKFSEDAIATLQSYNWPGNVRELRNVIERLLIMAPGGSNELLKASAIPAEIRGEIPASTQGARNDEILGLPLREAREIFEREYLIAQVTRFGGNISRTAAFVGMERSALHRKLKSLGVNSEDKARAPGG